MQTGDEDSSKSGGQEHIGLPQKTEKVTLNRHNIAQFSRMNNPRRIREEQVRKIHVALLEGHHFAAPIVINECGDQLHIVDGNHRIEAIKRWVNGNNRQIDVEIHWYKKADEKGENDIFRIYNSGKTQSFDDYLQNLRGEVDIIYDIVDSGKFPAKVHIYPIGKRGMEGISLRPLLGAYWHSKVPFTNGVHRDTFAEWAKSLVSDDFDKMARFAQDFQEIFGRFGSDNQFQVMSFLVPFSRVYFLNSKTYGLNNFKERVKRKIVGNPLFINNIRIYGTRLLYGKMAQDICDVLNKGIRDKTALCRWELPQECKNEILRETGAVAVGVG